MPSLGSFIIIKNEAQFIAAHLLMWLPHLDQMVFFDGNSTDGTLEIIKAIRAENRHGDKIKLYENRDCADMKDDYVRVFNEALRSLDTDLAMFLHPDMIPSVVNPEKISQIAISDAVALSCKMRSFAGEPGCQLFEMVGRGQSWKNIFRLRNPDLGAHYHGWYGAHNEDVYFSAITGDEHEHHGHDFSKYPYGVVDSGLEILHFSDVRTYGRRLERMKTCLANQGKKSDKIDEIAAIHPRVTLENGAIAFFERGAMSYDNFTLVPSEYPTAFSDSRNLYRHLEKELATV